MGRLFLLTVVLAASASADVWADPNRGRQLYLEAGGYGCAVCHGQVGDGAGQAGGYIRGASFEALDESFLMNAPMQPLGDALSDQDLFDLTAYLAELGRKPLITAQFENGEWRGQAEPFEPGQTIDLVLYNATFEPITVDFAIFDPPVDIPALGTEVWTGVIQDSELNLPGLTLETL